MLKIFVKLLWLTVFIAKKFSYLALKQSSVYWWNFFFSEKILKFIMQNIRIIRFFHWVLYLFKLLHLIKILKCPSWLLSWQICTKSWCRGLWKCYLLVGWWTKLILITLVFSTFPWNLNTWFFKHWPFYSSIILTLKNWSTFSHISFRHSSIIWNLWILILLLLIEQKVWNPNFSLFFINFIDAFFHNIIFIAYSLPSFKLWK